MAHGRTLKRRAENEVEFGRIVAFSDGVFSIAITLLVLNLGIDKGLTEGKSTTPSGTSGKRSSPTRSASP